MTPNLWVVVDGLSQRVGTDLYVFCTPQCPVLQDIAVHKGHVQM